MANLLLFIAATSLSRVPANWRSLRRDAAATSAATAVAATAASGTLADCAICVRVNNVAYE